MVAAGFEEVQGPGDVRTHVFVRMRQRVPHAGLCGKVNDPIELSHWRRAGPRLAVGDVDLLKREA